MIEETLTKIENREFFLIAGPCAVESKQVCFEVAERVSALADKYKIPYIFKASYKKANRSAPGSFSGLGFEKGLDILQAVKDKFNLPILTDIHETIEIDRVAEVADILQIPAFLCRQTDLVVKAGQTGKWVNIKKGQFMAPGDMGKIAGKTDSKKVMLTERGASFGYNNLIVDFTSLIIMAETGLPVIYDVTHSLQLPAGSGTVSTGRPDYIIPMARAAMAVGIDGLFVETHPRPSEAKSDAGSMLPLEKMEELIKELLNIKEAVRR